MDQFPLDTNSKSSLVRSDFLTGLAVQRHSAAQHKKSVAPNSRGHAFLKSVHGSAPGGLLTAFRHVGLFQQGRNRGRRLADAAAERRFQIDIIAR